MAQVHFTSNEIIDIVTKFTRDDNRIRNVRSGDNFTILFEYLVQELPIVPDAVLGLRISFNSIEDNNIVLDVNTNTLPGFDMLVDIITNIVTNFIGGELGNGVDFINNQITIDVQTITNMDVVVNSVSIQEDNIIFDFTT